MALVTKITAAICLGALNQGTMARTDAGVCERGDEASCKLHDTRSVIGATNLKAPLVRENVLLQLRHSERESCSNPKLCPQKPGCYFKQSTASAKCGGPFLTWERDAWGEKNENSGASESICKGRKVEHDTYCGVRSEWLFVASQKGPTSDLPSTPGCYFKQPTSSSKCGGPFVDWKWDSWGEANTDSKTNETACMARKSGHDTYCEVETVWTFVDLRPGCYFTQPTASSKCGGPFVNWRRDAWGEKNEDSASSETACLGRKVGHDSYCEVSTQWKFVAPQQSQAPTHAPALVPTSMPTSAPTPDPTVTPTRVPTLEPTSSPTVAPTPTPTKGPSPASGVPTAPGCYFKQPVASTKCGGPFLDWERDAWGEANKNSASSEASCKSRQVGHDEYCGVGSEWLYVGMPAGSVLKVMSYNTQYNNYASRVEGYGRKIAEVGPAIVGTQECQDKYALARASGYNVVPGTDFQNPIFYNPNLVTFVEGSSGWMRIPRDNYAPRTMTWAKFRFGSQELWLFNIHLPHNHGEAASRNTHARIAQRLLQKRRELGAEDAPTVVTGDMNTFASAGAPEGSFESNLVDAGFMKSYQARGNPGHAGLDQIFHTAAHFVKLQGADQGTGGSDHPAIIADLGSSTGTIMLLD
eukprot:TRINITY_DN3867_c0_g1_i7.p1 TRINITY_DN3867_c0_g1~~TRINITY_DN3867_c0_g1_i7.p1  ORF type:complete len:639 (-),score=75.49 TRINITY_DN3867_c0_g1_i7:403-2319(-)